MGEQPTTAAEVFGRDPTDPAVCVADGFGIRLYVRGPERDCPGGDRADPGA